MGLFDTLICKTALPVPKKRDELDKINWMTEEFQTKDFDCAMSEYEIREDGSLWVKTGMGEDWKKDTFSGSVRFYSFFMREQNDYWVEFLAYFENGKLMKDIGRDKWDVQSNTERVKGDIRLTNHMKEMRIRYNTKRWKYLFLPWNRVIRWNLRWMRHVKEWELRCLDWLERTLIVN